MSNDWMSKIRIEQLTMTKNWRSVFIQETTDSKGETVKKYRAWGIPEETFVELGVVMDKAESALQKARNEETRTKVTNEICREAFTVLEKLMRDVKKRYFFMPPLSTADYISLGFALPDTKPSPVVRPEGMVTAELKLTTIHQLRLIIRPVSGSLLDSRSDYGVRAYWGIMPPGGATLEEAAGTRHYLMKPPVSGEGLPNSTFTRRKTETIDFAPEDSGKTVYFCLRYENSKGETGPWGPLVSSVIP